MYCPNCGNSNPSGAIFCMGCGKQLPSFSTSVRCPFCGAEGQEYQLNCTKCGKELPKEQKVNPLTGTQATSANTKACPTCGRPMSIYARQCDYCSRPETDYSSDSYSESDYYVRETELPVIGGALILIAGVLGLITGMMIMVNVSSVGYYEGAGSVTCCGGILGLFGLIAIAGSFSALGRKSVAFAVVGGIFGILSIGFFIGALLSLIGIILVAISHDEFSE